jgi:hypothetical protein
MARRDMPSCRPPKAPGFRRDRAVSATDLDLAVSSEHACEVLKEGTLAVSARHL